jgi:hypothetical protein
MKLVIPRGLWYWVGKWISLDMQLIIRCYLLFIPEMSVNVAQESRPWLKKRQNTVREP